MLSDTQEWGYYSSVPLNGTIAIGWLLDDSVLAINVDGIFIYDIDKKDIVFRDYEISFQKYISDDNLTFFVKNKNETVNIFGLRGGGGSILTKDNKWKLELAYIAWNIRVPKLLNYKSREAFF